MFVTLCITVLCIIVVYMYLKLRDTRLTQMADKFPGEECMPIFGNALHFGFTTTDLFKNVLRVISTWGPSLRIWIGPKLIITIVHPADLEIVLGSTRLLEKADDYEFLGPWLGNGLLTSKVSHWHHHRKILTPTFHFKILEQFVDVFNANGEILVDKLKKEANGPTFDIYRYITLAALDNICESAMGVQVHAQTDSASEYVRAVANMSAIVTKRMFQLWLKPDWLFSLTNAGRVHKKSLEILHSTTNKVIKQRRKEIIEAKQLSVSKDEDGNFETEIGSKKRLAFLDLMIEASFDENNRLSDEDIREEVDTFMFEGHDTTTSAISFTLWLLAHHPHIQDQVVNELRDVVPDRQASPTFQHLQAMKYLERVIKEALRLFPSVAFYGREATEDVTLHNGLVVPKGASLGVCAYMTHRMPSFFPDPEKFDPDRFLPENIQGRHPYAYIPFSAGSRNCIGQKFAMLEMKGTLFHILRSYKLLSVPGEELQLAIEIILKSMTGVKLKIVPRESQE